MDKYFGNIDLLQNTLLPYFCNDESLKLINKLFSKLNYKKFSTYLQPHGIFEFYHYKTKRLIGKETYKNGELDGLSQCWYDNGQLCQQKYYKNGLENGLSQIWYNNGQLWSEYHTENNIISSVWIVWYCNGQLMKKINNIGRNIENFYLY